MEEWQKENPEDNFLFKPLLDEGEGMQGMAATIAADASEAEDLDDDVVSLSRGKQLNVCAPNQMTKRAAREICWRNLYAGLNV